MQSEFQDWIKSIKEEEKLIIVEGKKDEKALNNLGITNIYCLSRKPLFRAVEEIAAKSKKVIILTDLDQEGKKIYSKLNSWLQNHGVEIDNYYREFLFRKTKLRQIEGISSHMELSNSSEEI